MERQGKLIKLLRQYLPVTFIIGPLTLTALAWAAASIVVTPSTGLSNGQTVSVSGSGLVGSSLGSILECNSDPKQPTVSVAGNAVPVSCSNPISHLDSTTKKGNLAATNFTIATGTVGPPASGTDSNGVSSSTDAPNYPCPPTQAQVEAGDSCDITFGDQNGDDVIQSITFTTPYTGSSSSTTTTQTTSNSTTTTKTTTTKSAPKKTTTTPSSTSTKSTPTSTTSTTKSTTTPKTTPTTTSTTNSSATPSSSTTTQTTANISITVDDTRGQPISGAKVTIDNKSSETTNKEGVASFQNVTSGAHTVTVSYPGHPSNVTKLTLTAGENKLVSIKLANKSSVWIDYLLAVVVIVVLGLGYWYLRQRQLKTLFSSPVAGSVVAVGVDGHSNNSGVGDTIGVSPSVTPNLPTASTSETTTVITPQIVSQVSPTPDTNLPDASSIQDQSKEQPPVDANNGKSPTSPEPPEIPTPPVES